MTEDKKEHTPKSFIVSVNGEGITTDLKVENSLDVVILDGLINTIKKVVKINSKKQTSIT